MIKSLFGIGLLASVVAIPSPEPEQIKAKLEIEPVEEIIIEEEIWKCPSCTPNEQILFLTSVKVVLVFLT